MTNEARMNAINENIQVMIDIVNRLDEDTIRWNPSSEEWSIIQIVSHVAEAIPYWVKQIQNIKLDPSAEWGRGLQDEDRLYAVSEEKINKSDIKELVSAIEEIPAKVNKCLRALSVKDMEIVAPSRNPNFKGKPIQFIVDNLIVKHIEGHVSQIKRNLSKRK